MHVINFIFLVSQPKSCPSVAYTLIFYSTLFFILYFEKKKSRNTRNIFSHNNQLYQCAWKIIEHARSIPKLNIFFLLYFFLLRLNIHFFFYAHSTFFSRPHLPRKTRRLKGPACNYKKKKNYKNIKMNFFLTILKIFI